LAAGGGSRTEMTTVGRPGPARPPSAATAASSAGASARGVPSTGTSPLPSACAVSAGPTSSRTSPVRPARSSSMSLMAVQPTRGLLHDGEQVPLVYHVALGDADADDGARLLGEHRDLHLHRLQQEQGGSGRDPVPRRGGHPVDAGGHLGADLGHLCPSSLL